MAEPRVSCLMPTADRRRFVPLAVRCFLAQDWPNRELVVLDDGVEPVADLLPSHPDIRYLRLPPGNSLGAKRNLCAEAAGGEFLMHWDDDDWMAPHRIRSQVEDLLAQDAEIGGADRLVFLDLADGRPWEYRYAGGAKRPWWLAARSSIAAAPGCGSRSPIPAAARTRVSSGRTAARASPCIRGRISTWRRFIRATPARARATVRPGGRGPAIWPD